MDMHGYKWLMVYDSLQTYHIHGWYKTYSQRDGTSKELLSMTMIIPATPSNSDAWDSSLLHFRIVVAFSLFYRPLVLLPKVVFSG